MRFPRTVFLPGSISRNVEGNHQEKTKMKKINLSLEEPAIAWSGRISVRGKRIQFISLARRPLCQLLLRQGCPLSLQTISSHSREINSVPLLQSNVVACFCR